MATRLRIFISHPSNQLTDHQPYGLGLLAWEFIRRLAARGHDIHVAVVSSALRQRLPSNLTLHDAAPWTPFSTLNPLENGIRIRRLFRRLSRERKFDVVHQLNPVEDARSALLDDSTPLVLGPFPPRFPRHPDNPANRTTLLGHIGLTLAGPVVQALDRRQERRAAALLLTTPAALSALHEPDRNPDRIHVIGYGVDTALFTPVAGGDASGRGPTILYLANLVRRKGILTLLQAFERLNERFPESRLRIAGAGPMEGTVRERLSSMRSANAVELVGEVKRGDVPGEMRRCDIYCLPARQEAFGATLLEAMASGKPVVTSDEYGPPHIVPGEGGRHVTPDDVDGLTDALIELTADPQLRTRMGRHNRRLAVSRYDWERVIDRLEEIYEGVAAAADVRRVRAAGDAWVADEDPRAAATSRK